MGLYNDAGERIHYKDGDYVKSDSPDDREQYTEWFARTWRDAQKLAEDTGFPVEAAFQWILVNMLMSTGRTWLVQYQQWLVESSKANMEELRKMQGGDGEPWKREEGGE